MASSTETKDLSGQIEDPSSRTKGYNIETKEYTTNTKDEDMCAHSDEEGQEMSHVVKMQVLRSKENKPVSVEITKISKIIDLIEVKLNNCLSHKDVYYTNITHDDLAENKYLIQI